MKLGKVLPRQAFFQLQALAAEKKYDLIWWVSIDFTECIWSLPRQKIHEKTKDQENTESDSFWLKMTASQQKIATQLWFRFGSFKLWKINSWNLKITHSKRNIILPNLHFWVPDVHFPGCLKVAKMNWLCWLWLVNGRWRWKCKILYIFGLDSSRSVKEIYARNFSEWQQLQFDIYRYTRIWYVIDLFWIYIYICTYGLLCLSQLSKHLFTTFVPVCLN